MTENHDHHDEDGHQEHHGSIKLFIIVWAALCVCTAFSFGAANSQWIMDTPAVGWSLMMAISCVKAMLVITFFMHLKWEANWKFVLTIPASIMSIFLVLMLVPDIGARTTKYASERWRYTAPTEEVHEAKHNAKHEEEHEEDHKK